MSLRINWQYTLGEILIVILGISIAFGINKISENYKENSLKLQYLHNIKNDVELDKIQLSANRDTIQAKISVAQEILPILNSDLENKMSYVRKIFNFITLVEFNPNDNTYKALINSGDFNLIDDFDLKKAIESHYSYYGSLDRDYERIESIQRNYVGDYFIHQLDYDELRSGKFGFKDEQLLKNIILSLRGAYSLNINSAKKGIENCDRLLKVLDEEL